VSKVVEPEVYYPCGVVGMAYHYDRPKARLLPILQRREFDMAHRLP